MDVPREVARVETTISDIVHRIQAYAPDAEVGPVMQSYLLAAQAHQGQFRKSGEAYLSHPLAVAGILADLHMDVETISTALLHDALEDNPITKEEMSAQVGPVITELVDGVTKIGKLKFRSKEELQAENFRKMLLAMTRDLRVILVKLADRLHNMRTLEGHKPEKRAMIARETLDVFAPIANRLGIHAIKAELEDLCFRYLDPEHYDAISAFLDRTQSGRESYIDDTVAKIRDMLEARGFEGGQVSGRAKAKASIWRKMRKNNLAIDAVPDLLAFRVLVPDMASCYVVLGYVHATWAPVPGRIKDYIAQPKANGYQSLHTTVVGPGDRRIEVQIRTPEMHQVAERGIAAHWVYKEGHLAMDPAEVVELSRIREVFETARVAEDPNEFMETVKVSFYADEVFVFTPVGEVKRFPRGATPLDFAYAIHSDIGDTCVGAKVDGRLVPLDHELQSGDTIEILTNPHQHPRRDWLDIARTSSAVSKIRRYLRRQEEETAVRMGKELLAAELDRLGWTIDRARSEGRVDPYVKARGSKTLEPVFVEIARGTRPASEVAQAILPEGAWISSQEQARTNRLQGFLQSIGVRKSRSPVRISGEDGLLVHYAGCCNPLPGEDVIGFITRGRGITVHRADCKDVQRLEADRLVPVEWERQKEGARHSNTLAIYIDNKPGMLSRITTACERAQVNIERAEAKGNDGPVGRVVLQVAVRDLAELNRLIQSMQQIPEVQGVERIQG